MPPSRMERRQPHPATYRPLPRPRIAWCQTGLSASSIQSSGVSAMRPSDGVQRACHALRPHHPRYDACSMATMTVVAPLLIGAAAGAIATVAMSAVMLGARWAGVSGELPPERIARRTINAVSGEPVDDQQADAIASAAHLGFGAIAGAAFTLLAT